VGAAGVVVAVDARQLFLRGLGERALCGLIKVVVGIAADTVVPPGQRVALLHVDRDHEFRRDSIFDHLLGDVCHPGRARAGVREECVREAHLQKHETGCPGCGR
jgi:hypothetical protein